MQLDNHEYYISKESCGECITISKEALEKWAGHYFQNGKDIALNGKSNRTEAFKFGFYSGKHEVLIDLLKHFD